MARNPKNEGFNPTFRHTIDTKVTEVQVLGVVRDILQADFCPMAVAVVEMPFVHAHKVNLKIQAACVPNVRQDFIKGSTLAQSHVTLAQHVQRDNIPLLLFNQLVTLGPPFVHPARIN